jgi:hypothetical protein
MTKHDGASLVTRVFGLVGKFSRCRCLAIRVKLEH